MFDFVKIKAFTITVLSHNHHVGYFILKVLLVVTLSLETVSEVLAATPSRPPMMTRLLSWLQTLEYFLCSVRLRGSVTQPPCCTLHCMQLLSDCPPHSVLPSCTWIYLLSGSGGSSHVEFCHGLNNSADCSAPYPPVIRMASEMERFVLSRTYQHNFFFTN